MRIRKDKKLAELGLYDAAVVNAATPHVCQLNQSPWDVPATTSRHDGATNNSKNNSSSSFRSPLFQVVDGEEDELELEASLADSLDSSVASMDRERSVVVSDDEDDGDGIGVERKEKVALVCNKTNGKGWQCRKPAKRGHSMCRHHLNQAVKPTGAIATTPRAAAGGNKNKKAAGRGRAAKKAAAGEKDKEKEKENPYAFYYYTGFGPTWGRKRTAGGDGGQNVAPIDEEESDEEEDEHENGNGNGNEDSDSSSSSSSDDDGRKRMRRPVKERSLQSLM